jgi:hypothetical protein
LISASTPAEGEGISASTLSVEISKIGSSRFTASPTFFIQRERVPSAMDSPICGMMTSTRAIPHSVRAPVEARPPRRPRTPLSAMEIQRCKVARAGNRVKALHYERDERWVIGDG